jgi:outer membrane protein assembly factor BamB
MDPARLRHRATDLSPRSVHHRWDAPVRGNVFGGPAFIGASRVVVNVRAPGREGTVCAFDLDGGQLAWEHRLPRGSNAAPVAVGGVVVAVGEDGTVAGLDARTGQVVWQSELGGPLEGTPLVTDELLLASSGALMAIDDDGTERWSWCSSSPIHAVTSPPTGPGSWCPGPMDA